MKRTYPLGVINTIVAAGIVAHTLSTPSPSEEACKDLIGASFEPEMNREPGPAKPIRRESIEEDRLYDILSDVHWTQPESDDNEDSEMAEKDETER